MQLNKVKNNFYFIIVHSPRLIDGLVLEKKRYHPKVIFLLIKYSNFCFLNYRIFFYFLFSTRKSI
jgi:hypothetical protein